MTDEKKTAEKGSEKERRALTPAQRAEAITLWRKGGVTLDYLARRYGKRPETLSRMFTKLGVVKGEAVTEEVKKIEARIEEEDARSIDKTLNQIQTAKDEHYKMSRAVAGMAFRDMMLHKQAGKPAGELKESMIAYKALTDVLARCRDEIYTVLNVEKVEGQREDDDLPQLTVRELTQAEVENMRSQDAEDEFGADIIEDESGSLGSDMMPTEMPRGDDV